MSAPLESPRPPENPPERTQTGEMRAVVEPMLRDHDRRIKNSGWLRTVVATISGTGIAIAMFFVFVDNRVRAQTDAGIDTLRQRVVALEQQVPQLREEVYQGRLDTQALYKAVMDGKRQDRLEHPLPPPPTDGGQ